MASKQKLSPAAKKRKAARDLAFAKTPARRAKKAHAQREKDARRRGMVPMLKVKIGIIRMEDGRRFRETVQMMVRVLKRRAERSIRCLSVKLKVKNRLWVEL